MASAPPIQFDTLETAVLTKKTLGLRNFPFLHEELALPKTNH